MNALTPTLEQKLLMPISNVDELPIRSIRSEIIPIPQKNDTKSVNTVTNNERKSDDWAMSYDADPQNEVNISTEERVTFRPSTISSMAQWPAD